MPKAPAGSLAGGGRQQAGAAGQMFDKTKAKMIRPWFRQAAVPWKTTATQTRASGENRVSTKLGVLHPCWWPEGAGQFGFGVLACAGLVDADGPVVLRALVAQAQDRGGL